MLTLYKRGIVPIEDVERSLAETQESVGAVQAELAGIRAQERLAEAAAARLVDAASIIRQPGKDFDKLTPEEQREAIRRMIPEIVATTVELPASERKRGTTRKGYTLEARIVVGSWETIECQETEEGSESVTGVRSSMESRGSVRSPCAAPSPPGTARC
jgi:hypothetical protein